MSEPHVSAALRRLVRERAGERCEYCLIPEAMTWALLTIDHITAEKHGGVWKADRKAFHMNLFVEALLWRQKLNPVRDARGGIAGDPGSCLVLFARR
jgi:hypothetical protein